MAQAQIVIPLKDEALKSEIEAAFIKQYQIVSSSTYQGSQMSGEQMVQYYLTQFLMSVVNAQRGADANSNQLSSLT